MKQDDAEEYTRSLGQIVSGSYRQLALARRLGVHKALGLEFEVWVRDRLGGYVKLSVEERRKAVAELKADEGLSNRAVAEVLGVDPQTIANDLKGAENSAPAIADTSDDAEPAAESAEFSAPLDAVAILAADEKITKAARPKRKSAPAARLAPPDGRYRTIVIDPPWPVEKIEFERRPVERQEMDYQTMSLERIEDEVGDIVKRCYAEDGCHVYLWVTHRFLQDGLRLFEAWGVRYECLLTWYKPTAMPLWWMFNTEHCLFGKIGVLPPLVKGRPVGFRAPQQRHSHKPDEFFELVREVSPGPRLTVFDEAREGFTHWGIQHVDAG